MNNSKEFVVMEAGTRQQQNVYHSMKNIHCCFVLVEFREESQMPPWNKRLLINMHFVPPSISLYVAILAIDHLQHVMWEGSLLMIFIFIEFYADGLVWFGSFLDFCQIYSV